MERELPKLAAYLGHVHVADTYWYIEAVPQLLQLAAAKDLAASMIRNAERERAAMGVALELIRAAASRDRFDEVDDHATRLLADRGTWSDPAKSVRLALEAPQVLSEVRRAGATARQRTGRLLDAWVDAIVAEEQGRIVRDCSTWRCTFLIQSWTRSSSCPTKCLDAVRSTRMEQEAVSLMGTSSRSWRCPTLQPNATRRSRWCGASASKRTLRPDLPSNCSWHDCCNHGFVRSTSRPTRRSFAAGLKEAEHAQNLIVARHDEPCVRVGMRFQRTSTQDSSVRKQRGLADPRTGGRHREGAKRSGTGRSQVRRRHSEAMSFGPHRQSSTSIRPA